MGAWGVQLYQSDVALDVKERFAIWSRIPGSTRDLVRAVISGSPAATDRDDEDYPDIWLTLADQVHAHGLHDEETFRRARQVVTAGLDDASMRARGLSPGEASRRSAVMGDLLDRWSKPHPRPKSRKVLRAPEPHSFETGTLVAYPTCGGEARNHADATNRLGWFPDGWGSAIVLATGHEHGWFAWTAAARLSVHGRDMPCLQQLIAAAIENQPWDMNWSGEGTLAVQVGALSPAKAKRMGFVALGRVELDAGAVGQLSSEIDAPKQVPPSTIYSVFTWWEPGVKPLREMRSDGISAPTGVIPLHQLLL